MLWCDNNPGILKWNSEQIVIPYVKPETGKIHRYFVDFIIQYKTRSGEIKTSLVEIKPKTQTQAPVKGKKRNKTYINEVITYTTNQAKWKAATKYAMERGMDFKVLTEEHLFGK